MVARNLFFNYREKASRNVSLEEEMKRSDEEKDLLANMIENERKLQLYQALKKLDMKKREILLLQYFGDLSQKEIAAVLHITPENVRVLAYRAKKELKKYMEQQGG